MKLFRTLLLSAVLLVACGKDAVSIGNDVQRVQVFNANMPVGPIMDQKHGKETRLAVGAVMGIGGVNANGVAFAHSFADGAYILTGQLNIAIATEGSFYQAWLMNEETGERVEAGRPQPTMGDVRHGIRFESDKDLSSFHSVLITLEKDDGNPEAGLLVAAGTLKEQKRSK